MSNERIVSQEQLLYMHLCKNYDSEKVYPMTPSKTFSKIAGVPYDPLQNFLQNGHFVPYDPAPYDQGCKTKIPFSSYS